MMQLQGNQGNQYVTSVLVHSKIHSVKNSHCETVFQILREVALCMLYTVSSLLPKEKKNMLDKVMKLNLHSVIKYHKTIFNT